MKRGFRVATAAALALLPSAVLATAVIAETIDEMARAAPLVVRGQVVQVQPQWDERGARIYTYADVQVTQVLKGPGLASVLVKSPGGEIGARGQRVAGAAHFSKGQDTVLFLEPAVDERGVWIIRSLAAGKVDVERSSKGELRAIRRLDGLAFFATGRPSLRDVHPEEDFGTPEQLLSRILLALKGGAP